MAEIKSEKMEIESEKMKEKAETTKKHDETDLGKKGQGRRGIRFRQCRVKPELRSKKESFAASRV